MRNASDEDQPTRHDAIIVIFGAAVRSDGSPSPTLLQRVDAAAAFGRRFSRPLFVPTGAKGRFGPAEAAVMQVRLQEHGYDAASVLREETGTDTLSSVRAVTRLIRHMPPAPIYACTSFYHLARCILLLRLAGVNARAAPPPRVPSSTRVSLRWYWRFREMPALPYDAMIMIWLRLTRRV